MKRLTGFAFRHRAAVIVAFAAVTAFFGFWIAYQLDLPVGPTDVVLLGVLYGVAWTVARLLPGGLRRVLKT